MMTPTFKLRFVQRQIPLHPMDRNIVRTVKVLQQWWEDRNTDVHWLDGNPGEWRDVPTGEE
jgi:hypothetical protein